MARKITYNNKVKLKESSIDIIYRVAADDMNEIKEVVNANSDESLNFVKKTDYATTSKTGVIKLDNSYAVSVSSSNGNIYADTKTYAFYQSGNNGMFIGKGTLENVITGKELVTKTQMEDYINSLDGNEIKY